MESTPNRTCIQCSTALPNSSRKDTRYCSNRCRSAARRERARTESIGPNVRWQLNQLRRENTRLTARHDRLKATLKTSRSDKAKLERLVAKRDSYISGQAQKIAAARGRSTQLLIERDEARAEATAANRSAEIDPAKYEQTRQHLEEGRAAYRALRSQYEELAGALDGAARERESLKEIVRSGDGLCQRLHKETKGNPRSPKDRETLALWADFRAHISGETTQQN